ncbi:MAG: hypothetical protein PHN63_02875 [Candidatus Omnitrophica bacterium]|nr:hypothetical protein [Candidatus Omnitrophota bacterium]
MVSGPSPWDLRGKFIDRPDGQGRLEWQEKSGRAMGGKVFLCEPGNPERVYMILDFGCHVLVRGDRLIVWRNKDESIEIKIFKLYALRPMNDYIPTCVWMEENKEAIAAFGLASEVSIPTTGAPKEMDFSFPDEFKILDELLVVTDAPRARLRGGPDRCIFIIRPKESKIRATWQDWYNHVYHDLGYEEIVKVTRDPVSGNIFGIGNRIGDFVLDPAGSEFLYWMTGASALDTSERPAGTGKSLTEEAPGAVAVNGTRALARRINDIIADDRLEGQHIARRIDEILELVCKDAAGIERALAAVKLIADDVWRIESSYMVAENMAEHEDRALDAADMVCRLEPRIWAEHKAVTIFNIALKMMRYESLRTQATAYFDYSIKLMLVSSLPDSTMTLYFSGFAEKIFETEYIVDPDSVFKEMVDLIASSENKPLAAVVLSELAASTARLDELAGRSRFVIGAARKAAETAGDKRARLLDMIAKISEPKKKKAETPLQRFRRRVKEVMREVDQGQEISYQASRLSDIASEMAAAGFIDEARLVFKKAMAAVKKGAKEAERCYREIEGEKLDWLDLPENHGEDLDESNPWRLFQEIAIEMGKYKELRKEAIALAESIKDERWKEFALEEIGPEQAGEEDREPYKILTESELIDRLLGLEYCGGRQEALLARLAVNPGIDISDELREEIIDRAADITNSREIDSDDDICDKANTLGDIAREAAKLERLTKKAKSMFGQASKLADTIESDFEKRGVLVKLAGDMSGQPALAEMAEKAYDKAIEFAGEKGAVDLGYVVEEMVKHGEFVGKAAALPSSVDDPRDSTHVQFIAIREMAKQKGLIGRALKMAKLLNENEAMAPHQGLGLCRVAEEMAKYKELREMARNIVDSTHDTQYKVDFLRSMARAMAKEPGSAEAVRKIFDEMVKIKDSGAESKSYVAKRIIEAFAEHRELWDDVIAMSKEDFREHRSDIDEALVYLAGGMAKDKDSVGKAEEVAGSITSREYRAKAYCGIASEMASREDQKEAAKKLFEKGIELLGGKRIDSNESRTLIKIAKAMSGYTYLINRALGLFASMKSKSNKREVLVEVVSSVTDHIEQRLASEPEYARKISKAIADRFEKKGHPSYAFRNMPNGQFTLRQYNENTGVPRSTARMDFKALKEMGVVTIKKGRGNIPGRIENAIPDMFNADVANTLRSYRDRRDMGCTMAQLSDKLYDTNFTTILSTDLAYAQLHEDSIYDIKYDISRLSRSQIEIIEEYIKLLKKRSSRPGNIRPKPFSGAKGSGEEALISIYCKGRNFKGEGHVDVSIPAGEMKEYIVRITGMMNIAFASSNIPDNLSIEEVNRYRPVVSYIRNQYKAILGEELARTDTAEEILKVIKKITLDLPRSMRTDIERIEEFNRLARNALTAA